MSSNSTSFNFNDMMNGLVLYVEGVQQYLLDLEVANQGTVDLGTMFNLQFRMQILSQYVEATSNVLTGVHSGMITMARAAKGS